MLMKMGIRLYLVTISQTFCYHKGLSFGSQDGWSALGSCSCLFDYMVAYVIYTGKCIFVWYAIWVDGTTMDQADWLIVLSKCAINRSTRVLK